MKPEQGEHTQALLTRVCFELKKVPTDQRQLADQREEIRTFFQVPLPPYKRML